MKVLLIDPALPAVPGKDVSWAPLGLAYLATALRKAGHSVALHSRLVSQLKQDLDFPAMDRLTTEVLRSEKPRIVGISGATASYADIKAIARLAREVCPEALIALGGPHATVAAEETFQRIPEADVLVVGEGEEALTALADGCDPSTLPGVHWRDGNGGGANPWQPPGLPLDEIGAPSRDLMDMGWFMAHGSQGMRGSHRRTVTMISSRGCPHRCAFCSEPAYTVRGVRYHSAEATVAEAEDLIGRYPIDTVVFLDEMLMANRKRALEICDLWRSRGLHEKVTFCGQTRADAVDGELLREMAAAGLYQLELGVESGSDVMLERMNKGLTVEQNREALRLCREHGIRVQANIVSGAPGESEEQLRASIDFVAETRPAAVSFMRFQPLPGTRYVNDLIAEGRLEPDYWAIEERGVSIPRHHFADMPEERFEELHAQGRRLSRELNSESWLADAPWWTGGRRRVGMLLRRLGLRH